MLEETCSTLFTEEFDILDREPQLKGVRSGEGWVVRQRERSLQMLLNLLKVNLRFWSDLFLQLRDDGVRLD